MSKNIYQENRTNGISAAPGEPCAVKPLEWEARSSDALTFDANTPIGHFIAGLTEDDCGMWFIVGQTTSNRVIGGVEAAKAAAQADYEKRIRSALVTTPQPAAGWDEGDCITCYERDEAACYDGMCLRTGCRLRNDRLRREAPAPADLSYVSQLIAENNELKDQLAFRPDSSEARLGALERRRPF